LTEAGFHGKGGAGVGLRRATTMTAEWSTALLGVSALGLFLYDQMGAAAWQVSGNGGIRPLLAVAAFGAIGYMLYRAARVALWLPLALLAVMAVAVWLYPWYAVSFTPNSLSMSAGQRLLDQVAADEVYVVVNDPERGTRCYRLAPETGSGTGAGLGAGESRENYTVVTRDELPTTGTVKAFYLVRPSVATLKDVMDVGSVYPTWGNEAMRIPRQYRHY